MKLDAGMKLDMGGTSKNDIGLDHPQTRMGGTLEDEYEIYVANAEDLGWDVKAFDEWLG